MALIAQEKVPHELVPYVIVHLGEATRTSWPDYMRHYPSPDEIRNLCACSLVSKIWLHSARSKLFEFFSLNINDDSNCTRMLHLADLTNHPLCTFSSYVKRTAFFIPKSIPAAFPAALEAATMPFQTSVRSLSVTFGTSPPFSGTSLGLAMRSFKNTTQLHLSCLEINSFEPFAQFMNTFPALKVLHIELSQSHIFNRTATPNDVAPCGLHQLTELHLEHFDTLATTLRWITPSQKSKPSIRVIDIKMLMYEDYPSLRALLMAIGPLLETVALSAMGPHRPEMKLYAPHYRLLDFSANVNLKKITLIYEMHTISTGTTHGKSPWYECMFPAFDQLASTSLQEVVIYVLVDEASYLRLYDWHLIDAKFRRPRFENLHVVRVDVNVRTGYRDSEEKIEQTHVLAQKELDAVAESMPICRERGVLAVSRTSEYLC